MPNSVLQEKKANTRFSEKKPRKRFSWAFLARVIAASIITIVGLELVFAWAGIGEQECLKIDSDIGYSLFKNKNVTWRREGFSRVRFNSYGMQDREYPVSKPSHTRRVAVVGDSYVEALQVDRSENFCSLLESSLNKSKFYPESVEVMNFGIQAHNLSQTYLNLKKSVFRFAPDMVVLPYRPDSTYLLPPDLKRGFLGARPNFFVGQDGELIEDKTVQDLWLKTKDAKRMKSTNWLRKNSRIWGAFSTGMEAYINWQNKGGLLTNFINPEQSHTAPTLQSGVAVSLEEQTPSGFTRTNAQGEQSIQATWPIANALISDMAKLCRENNCQLLIVRFPGVRGHVSEKETQLLKETARKNGLPYLDLTNIFHQYINAGEKLFIDTHPTKLGHRIIASELYRFVHENISW